MRRAWLASLVVPVLAALAQDVAAQPARAKRIGVLQDNATPAATRWHSAFVKGLADLGWMEGKDFVLERRSADGTVERLPRLAAELVTLKPDLIFAPTTVAARAAAKATHSIPIVFASANDPVAAGLAVSLVKPGRNATGLTNILGDLSAKRLQMLQQVVPGATRVAAMHAGDFTSAVQLAELRRAATSLGMETFAVEARGPDDYPGAVAAMRKWRADVVFVIGSVPFFTNRGRIIGELSTAALPASYTNRDFVVEGGLISYGPDFADLFRRAASYVDRIFKGAKPGDLPIEQPTKLELVINVKTAKTLGLAIPASLLARADELID
jgi:putative ABC transport system substrate-binding protein